MIDWLLAAQFVTAFAAGPFIGVERDWHVRERRAGYRKGEQALERSHDNRLTVVDLGMRAP